jgi:hypothetical protein
VHHAYGITAGVVSPAGLAPPTSDGSRRGLSAVIAVGRADGER